MSLTLDAPPTGGLDAQPRRDYLGCDCNSPAWAVAQTHPQAERWASSNLQQRGYRTFLPLCAIRVRDRVLPTMTRIVMKPLFSGYVFVQHHRGTSWRPIYETPGIASVLKNGNQIQYASAGDITMLEASEEARATIPPPGASIAAGDAVRVASGPVRDVDAVVTEVDGPTARIGLVMFGALRTIAVPITSLVARE